MGGPSSADYNQIPNCGSQKTFGSTEAEAVFRLLARAATSHSTSGSRCNFYDGISYHDQSITYN